MQTKKLSHMLLTLLVEDGNGVGRPVAYSVTTRDDDTMHVKQFLNFFSEHNNVQLTEILVTDKAVAEIDTVQRCWPNCRPFICHFHIMSSLEQYVKSCEFSTEDRKQCTEVKYLLIFLEYYYSYSQ